MQNEWLTWGLVTGGSIRRTRLPLLVATCLLAFGCCTLNADDSITAKDALAELADYPFASHRDLARINALARGYLLGGVPSQMGTEATESFRDSLAVIDAFTAGVSPAGENVRIISFSRSDDPALRRLRDRVRLPPPAGGAVVRTYAAVSDMPPELRKMFGEEAAGITYLYRFIALWTGGRSDEEIANILSHELVHAYLMSSMGLDGWKLPHWFHEGAALYLSGGKSQYVSHSDYGATRVSWSPKSYNQWRRVFQYLDSAFGPDEVEYFIKRCVEERSTRAALRDIAGVSGYSELLRRANSWALRRQLVGFAAAVTPVVLFIVFLRRRARWLREEMLDDDEI